MRKLLFLTAAKPHFHKRKRFVQAGPTPLELASAELIGGSLVRLTFDRGIDTNTYTPGQMTLNNANTSQMLVDEGLQEITSPTTIVVSFSVMGEYLGSTSTLTATAMTGIDDTMGQTWAGVTDYIL